MCGSEFAIAQHFADGFDPAQFALKPNFLRYGRVALVRRSDQVLLAIGIKACGKSCTLFSFQRGFPLLPVVEEQEVRGFVSRVVPLSLIHI